MLSFIIKSLITIIFILISVAYFTLAERKLLAVVQRRKGPNVVGTFGLFQPISDGIKLFLKEFILPSNSDKILFILSPVFTFFISLTAWPFIPNSFLVNIDFSLLYLIGFSALGIYGILFSGWSSNSSYGFLGSLRSVAQMISYEIPLGFGLFIVMFISESLNINDIIFFKFNTNISLLFYFPIIFGSVLICWVAETNRHPFDLPEAEAELVSGYNVEYSAMEFALFSLAEYSNILVACSILIFLFSPNIVDNNIIIFGFLIKLNFFIVFFVFLRAGLPRYRYDQLMNLCWTSILPLILIQFFLIFFYLVF